MTAKARTKQFLLNEIYTDPSAAFLYKPAPLEKIKDHCLIFIDTNVLLIPYSTGKNSLESIAAVYRKLIEQKRLFIPERAMQEFENNVPDQLQNLFHSLELASNTNIKKIGVPLLENVPEYKSLQAAEENLIPHLKSYREAVKSAQDVIQNWNHDDPVRCIYREIFTADQAAKISSMDEPQLLIDWAYRLANKIPPGYKDSAKDDTGIGDYLIWKAVLDVCKTKNADAIIVTGEIKPDWWHQSSSRPLYPRREMVEEFRHATGGKSVLLMPAAQFFQNFGASKEAIAEIKQEETKQRNAVHAENAIDDLSDRGLTRLLLNWAQSAYPDAEIVDLTMKYGPAILVKSKTSGKSTLFIPAFERPNLSFEDIAQGINGSKWRAENIGATACAIYVAFSAKPAFEAAFEFLRSDALLEMDLVTAYVRDGSLQMVTSIPPL